MAQLNNLTQRNSYLDELLQLQASIDPEQLMQMLMGGQAVNPIQQQQDNQGSLEEIIFRRKSGGAKQDNNNGGVSPRKY